MKLRTERKRGGSKILSVTIAALFAVTAFAVVLTTADTNHENEFDEIIGAAGVSPAISAGGQYSLALKSDGTVWAWGYNVNGELGDGTTTDRNTPVQVHGPGNVGFLTGVTAISAGSNHSLALKSDGTVWAWGWNGEGELGNGSTANSSTPVQVNGLTGVTAISAGSYHSLALKGDGTVWAWGHNNEGQLGIGSTTDSSTPVQISSLTGVTAISAGHLHSLALKGDGTVSAWGYNGYGQIGDGTDGSGTNKVTPVDVFSGAKAISAGGYHSLALKNDGTVSAWGHNGNGQLGDGTYSNTNTPADTASSLTGVTAISAGDNHSVALKGDGTVWAWGGNAEGQLGDGTTTVNSRTPVQVKDPAGTGLLTGVKAIVAGYDHVLALKDDGTVFAWGYNSNGQLGNGSTADSNLPIQTSISLIVPADGPGPGDTTTSPGGGGGKGGISILLIIAIIAVIAIAGVAVYFFVLKKK